MQDGEIQAVRKGREEKSGWQMGENEEQKGEWRRGTERCRLSLL